MTKIRKLKRSKRFRFSVNRKRLRNQQNKVPQIHCKQIKNAWKKGKSIATNLTDMGLACDPNKSLVIPTIRTVLQPNGSEDSICTPSTQSTEIHPVADAIEMEAKLPRVNDFQLPASTVQSLTYFVKRYKDDYEAMARDRKNFYQETAQQLKAKIKKMNSAKLTKTNQSKG